jgi:hypothetical protein
MQHQGGPVHLCHDQLAIFHFLFLILSCSSHISHAPISIHCGWYIDTLSHYMVSLKYVLCHVCPGFIVTTLKLHVKHNWELPPQLQVNHSTQVAVPILPYNLPWTWWSQLLKYSRLHFLHLRVASLITFWISSISHLLLSYFMCASLLSPSHLVIKINLSTWFSLC